MRPFLMSLAILISGCSQPEAEEGARSSGSGAERSFEVGAFDRIAVEGFYDVQVIPGERPQVRASGDPRALELLLVRVEGGTLHIAPRRHTRMDFLGDGPKVIVIAPSIAAVSLAGSGNMKIDQVEGATFAGSVAGNGNLELDKVNVERLQASLAGAGNLRVEGQAREANFRIAGSGDAEAATLVTQTAQVNVSGSGYAKVHAKETANISVAGSGMVEVKGGAHCNVQRTGSGEVHCD